MGDHAIDMSATATPAGVPVQVLARWAALAAERACFGVVPTQAETA